MRARAGILPAQTQSSIAVSIDGMSWILLNASPDIREQLTQNHQLTPKETRGSPVKSVILTNGDIDHISGLLVLREKTPFSLHATSEVLKIISENSVFDVLDSELIDKTVIHPGVSFQPLKGLTVTPYYVPGKVPLYKEEEDVKTSVISEYTIGLELNYINKTLQYVPGCAMITDEINSRFAYSDLVLFDGTVWQNDEMIKTSTGYKTGLRMGHIPISGPNGSMNKLKLIEKPQVYYIHINNTNPILDPGSPERAIIEKVGLKIASDRKVISL